MAARIASKLCRSVFTINSRNYRRVWSPLLRFQAANPLVRSNGSSRIFSSGISLYQAVQAKNSEAEWRKKLTPEQFRVCRQKGTEPPWSGEYADLKIKGTYKCVCCGSDLFSSSAKFDSGTGWPSFHSAIQTTSSDGQSPQPSVTEEHDDSHGMVRIEVLCRQCDSHLGHVFPDGPPPTGLRYCINSISLQFHPEDNE